MKIKSFLEFIWLDLMMILAIALFLAFYVLSFHLIPDCRDLTEEQQKTVFCLV